MTAALLAAEANLAGIKYPIQTFSIGMEGSSDIAAARKVHQTKVFSFACNLWLINVSVFTTFAHRLTGYSCTFRLQVAAHIGSDHHEVTFIPEEGIALLKEVIYYLESYDISVVRPAVCKKHKKRQENLM